MMKELARGAEAIIYANGNTIIKDRIAKTYRHPTLDVRLRTTRAKREAKVLSDISKIGVPGPKLISLEKTTITMEYLGGDKLREHIDAQPELAAQVGAHMAKLHDKHIIHGDLTTSNMILQANGIIALIDFGLSIHSTRIEDKAVDLHLFKQALESKHYLVATRAWKYFLSSYQPKERQAILERLKLVEQRGRNKR